MRFYCIINEIMFQLHLLHNCSWLIYLIWYDNISSCSARQLVLKHHIILNKSPPVVICMFLEMWDFTSHSPSGWIMLTFSHGVVFCLIVGCIRLEIWEKHIQSTNHILSLSLKSLKNHFKLKWTMLLTESNWK